MRNSWTKLAGRATRVAALGTIVGVMAGCQLWNGMLGMLMWKDSQTAGGGQITPIGVPTNPSSGGPVTAVMIPRVTVYRLTLPVGAFTGNERIWSQLNEDAMDSKTTVLLAQNGLRAGTGSAARWPTIAKLISDLPGAVTEQAVYGTEGRRSVNVPTRPNVTDQIVVSIDRDLQQQGRTFERCDNGFRLTMWGMRDKPQLQVQLEPVVTLGTVTVSRNSGDLGVTRTGFTSEESFEDLRMSATLSAEQFLVVSAMDPKTSPFSVGTLWLSDRDHSPATETVLVFVPATGK